MNRLVANLVQILTLAPGIVERIPSCRFTRTATQLHPLMLLFCLSLFILLVVVASAVELCLGNRQLLWLKTVPPFTGDSGPHVLVIIAACNEEKKIEQGVQSMLGQDYKNLRIVVINDRSTDRTGSILDRLARAHPRLRVIHNAELPVGWLGKNHALYLGTQQANSEIFLFVDADIIMDATTISRAVQHLQREQLDHLTLTGHLRMPGILLQMFAGAFVLFFGFFAKPWKAKDPRSKRHIGIGTFNMVRAEVYRRAGTHQAIAMRPDDDLMLGKLIKKHGYRQEVLLASDLVSVEWYSSFKELCRGLEKNSYAGLNYNPALAVGATIAQWLVFVWPFIGMFVTSGVAQALNMAACLVLVMIYRDNAGFHGLKRWHGVALPFTTLLFSFVIWRSIVLTIKNDGIDWRGTRYRLSELKANRV